MQWCSQDVSRQRLFPKLQAQGRGQNQGKAEISKQWRRQLWDTGARAPSTSNNFIFSLRWSKSDSQLSKYCAVCEIGWCRCQQLAALSISTALVTELLVIDQLLYRPWSSPWMPYDLFSSFAPPGNKSWRRHCFKVWGKAQLTTKQQPNIDVSK